MSSPSVGPIGSMRARRHLAAFLGLAALVVVAWASPAAAHVDLLESSPANVSTVAGPVTTVRFTFSGEADPVDDQFRIEDTQGNRLAIGSVENDGAATIVVTPAAPLPTGRSKVTWALRGADGHTMSGTIAFTVTAPPGTTAPSVPSTAAGGTATTIAPPAATAAIDGDTATDIVSVSSGDDGSSTADLLATLARWIVYAAVLFCVGGLVYLAAVHRGTRAESRRLVFYVRRAALVVVVFAIVEWLAELVVYDFGSASALVSPSTWIDLATSGFGIGTAFRLLGAALVLRFLSIEVDSTEGSEGFDRVDLSWIADDGVATGAAVSVADPTADAAPARVRIEASPLAFVGAALLVLSESFIGHTASVGSRIVMAVSDAVHMIAGGAWAAGAFLLAATLWRRNRRGEPTDARLLASRFSVLAAASVAAVGVSGLVLAWEILGSVEALWSTEFGRLLLVKIALVAVVAVIGAYNHRVMVPALVDGDPTVGDRFRRIVTIESAVFVVVLLVTALLVVANPT